jgi:hypothetical protein
VLTVRPATPIYYYHIPMRPATPRMYYNHIPVRPAASVRATWCDILEHALIVLTVRPATPINYYHIPYYP